MATAVDEYLLHAVRPRHAVVRSSCFRSDPTRRRIGWTLRSRTSARSLRWTSKTSLSVRPAAGHLSVTSPPKIGEVQCV